MKRLIKKVDDRGRIVIPKEWREKYAKHGRVIMKIINNRIEIIPDEDISRYIDMIEMDIDSKLNNWNNVKRDLMKID